MGKLQSRGSWIRKGLAPGLWSPFVVSSALSRPMGLKGNLVLPLSKDKLQSLALAPSQSPGVSWANVILDLPAPYLHTSFGFVSRGRKTLYLLVSEPTLGHPSQPSSRVPSPAKPSLISPAPPPTCPERGPVPSTAVPEPAFFAAVDPNGPEP